TATGDLSGAATNRRVDRRTNRARSEVPRDPETARRGDVELDDAAIRSEKGVPAMSLLALLLALIVVCVVIWAARALMAAFGIGDPIATVVYVILVLFALAF